jgi:hypothetical protein
MTFVAALLMGAAWFIWPTPYREYQVVGARHPLAPIH